MNTVKPLLFVL